jgi:hypothetical protein
MTVGWGVVEELFIIKKQHLMYNYSGASNERIPRATDQQIRYISHLQDWEREVRRSHRDPSAIKERWVNRDLNPEMWATAMAWISFFTNRGACNYGPYKRLLRIIAGEDSCRYSIENGSEHLLASRTDVAYALLQDIRKSAIGLNEADQAPPPHEEYIYDEDEYTVFTAILEAHEMTPQNWEWLGVEPMKRPNGEKWVFPSGKQNTKTIQPVSKDFEYMPFD